MLEQPRPAPYRARAYARRVSNAGVGVSSSDPVPEPELDDDAVGVPSVSGVVVEEEDVKSSRARGAGGIGMWFKWALAREQN